MLSRKTHWKVKVLENRNKKIYRIKVKTFKVLLKLILIKTSENVKNKIKENITKTN